MSSLWSEHGYVQGAHGKLSWILATCIASMPPLKAHRGTISCGKVEGSVGREAEQGIVHPSGGLVLGCWCLENGRINEETG
jgi:hypothetical protein